MNKIKASLWVAAALSVSLSALATPAPAKPIGSYYKEASVPFAFRIGNRYLPPGKYRLESRLSGSPSYYLTNVKTGRSLMVLCLSGNEERPTQLTFEKDERGYVLKEVQ